MGFVIANKLRKYMEDIIPHTARLLEVRLAGSGPLSLLFVYAPQSGQTETEKETFYEDLHQRIKSIPKKGPYLVMGDFNARLQEPDNEEEAEWIGPHTFSVGDNTTWNQSTDVEDNREHLLELCRNNNLLAINTYFCKTSKGIDDMEKPVKQKGPTHKSILRSARLCTGSQKMEKWRV